VRNPLIVFDGDCAWCSAWVQFLLRHDRKGLFRFATRRSAAAASRVAPMGVRLEEEHTLLVLEKGKLRRRSDAVLYILETLGGGWKLVSVFRLVPSPLRDIVYDRVAKYRHRLGRGETCIVPGENDQRFLS
jgi:predicted DCC family thiol-disulfide oxidoreductase YuxK